MYVYTYMQVTPTDENKGHEFERERKGILEGLAWVRKEEKEEMM